MSEQQQRNMKNLKWMDERMAVERRRSRELREMLRANRSVRSEGGATASRATATDSLSQIGC